MKKPLLIHKVCGTGLAFDWLLGLTIAIGALAFILASIK